MSFLRYELVSSPDAFAHAARALAEGRGPFAVDTERASAYRYDDRAFLVQVFRRDAGTFLFAPENHRAELSRALAGVINGQDWILHAAPEDLPSLAELGLHPGTVFDTALAGRILGFDRPNLGAMVDEFCGAQLAKGHGREDWSRVPLPAEWLEYAALDVAYLNELAEAQAESLAVQGKLDIANQEFMHIVDQFAESQLPVRTWRDLKGLSRLKSRESLAAAKALWNARDEIAWARDVAPASLLPNRVIIAIANDLPRTAEQLNAIDGFPARRRGATERWFTVLREVYRSDAETYPRQERRRDAMPGKSAWQRNYPESWNVLQTLRYFVAETAGDMNIAPELLLAPATLRQAVWTVTETTMWPKVRADTHTVALLLQSLGARPWQVAEVAPLFANVVSSIERPTY